MNIGRQSHEGRNVPKFSNHVGNASDSDVPRTIMEATVTNDRELARQAIAELMQIRHDIRRQSANPIDYELTQMIIRLIDWLHQYCTD